MYRIVFAFALLIAFTIYVRHQYRKVIHEVTSPPRVIFPAATQTTRHKCLLCGGTGRAISFTLFGQKSSASKSEPCPSCNGTGWVEDPLFGKK